MGVCPFGAQVRRTTGCNMKPDSSMKTMLRLLSRAFFYIGPGRSTPLRDGLVIPFPSSALRLLGAPSQSLKDLPDVSRVICDIKLALDHLGDTVQGPQVGWKTMRGRPRQEQGRQLLAFLGRKRGLGRRTCLGSMP